MGLHDNDSCRSCSRSEPPAAEFDNGSLLPGTGAENFRPPDQDLGSPPPLGSKFSMPAQECIENLPHLSSSDAALIKLWSLLKKAGSPLYLFDEVVSFIETHSGSTFTSGIKIDRRDALFRRLSKRFPVPKPEPVVVPLEHDGEEGDEHRRRPGDTVSAQRWDFQSVVQDLLLDPFIFGDTNNLVNKANPYDKYPPPDDGKDKELLASYWYSKTHDEKISDPKTEILLPLVIYLNKTGKSAGITSYTGEPVIFSTPLLTNESRQNANAWQILGYIPDLESSSSAKKRKASGRAATKGHTMRNYHNILKVILEGLVQTQSNGGFNAYVRMGDEIRYLKVIVSVACFNGDGKSGDTLCIRFGGKNCKGRVPRLCMMPFSKLDDPHWSCPFFPMKVAEEMYNKLVQAMAEAPIREMKREVKKWKDALESTSTHICDSALFGIDFGYNPFGATLGTPTDMMHCYESGTFRRYLKSLVCSMSTSVQAAFDALIEEMFSPLNSSCNKDFLCTNFRGGSTSLTMLSLHHWPGMGFAFLVALLSPRGREICKDCFMEEDAPDPVDDWSDDPGLDLDNVYNPPSLQGALVVAAGEVGDVFLEPDFDDTMETAEEKDEVDECYEEEEFDNNDNDESVDPRKETSTQ